MIYSRRDFTRLAVAAPLSAAFAPLLSAAKINSKIQGVMIGAQSYSFRDRPLDECIAAMKAVGLGYVELWQGHLEPKAEADKKKWREDPPLDQLKQARQKFDDAGILLYALNYSFRDNFSDLEIENGFKIAQALQVDKITASSNVDIGPRVDKYAEQYKTYVGFHNHDRMVKNEFARPEDWEEVMKGRSKYMKINLDIGHFTAANFDPVQFLEQHHTDILTLHIKDRKKNHGANLPFGEGETPIKEVLEVLKKKYYQIPAMIEYEYGKPGLDPVAEVKKCFEYMKAALA